MIAIYKVIILSYFVFLSAYGNSQINNSLENYGKCEFVGYIVSIGVIGGGVSLNII
jgi:hypothetical protein